MKLTLLFPNDYFNKNKINPAFEEEYSAAKLVGISCYLYSEEKWSDNEIVKIIDIPCNIEIEYCVYRGWMMFPEKYKIFTDQLKSKYNIELINTYDDYIQMHYFDKVYYSTNIKYFTPKIYEFEYPTDDYTFSKYYEVIKSTFENKFFMVKDNVKSVKDDDFPKKIPADIYKNDLKRLLDKFVKLRGSLYTGSIILKEYVDLKLYDGCTNEYRIFVCNNKIVSMSKNSNQPDYCQCNITSDELNHVITHLPGKYNTVDVAELTDDSWTILECGDGQVSGLSPNQNYIEYYKNLKEIYETI